MWILPCRKCFAYLFFWADVSVFSTFDLKWGTTTNSWRSPEQDNHVVQNSERERYQVLKVKVLGKYLTEAVWELFWIYGSCRLTFILKYCPAAWAKARRIVGYDIQEPWVKPSESQDNFRKRTAECKTFCSYTQCFCWFLASQPLSLCSIAN